MGFNILMARRLSIGLTTFMARKVGLGFIGTLARILPLGFKEPLAYPNHYTTAHASGRYFRVTLTIAVSISLYAFSSAFS